MDDLNPLAGTAHLLEEVDSKLPSVFGLNTIQQLPDVFLMTI